MARTRVGLPGIPARDDPEHAVELLLERGYDACEIDFEGGFWMDYPWAEKLGEVARAADVVLSVHAPLFGFMGHLEAEGRKFSSAVGALDRSAGIAAACGAEVVVFHPGFLLGRTREDAITLGRRTARHVARAARGQGSRGAVRDRGDGPRARPRLRRRRRRDLRADGLGATGARLRPHARDERRRVPRGEPVRGGARGGRRRQEPGTPFHIHFSDIAYANRNEKHHLPYGEGTLRADPLREALERFERPATVISESPDEASSQAIRAILARA